ncbi:MAG: hypothetical protein AB7K24_15975 [Gemmataceae bacterium]
MAVWRNVASMLALFLTAASLSAQTYPLVEKIEAGDCYQYSLDMHLTGDLHLQHKGKTVTAKLSATATHVFPERIQDADASCVRKVARVYETAQAVIVVGDGRSKRGLREDRCLIVVERPEEQTLTYCPKGALTREELELTDGHIDTLALTGLLPGKEVKLGETWPIAPVVVQALCHFDGLHEHNVTGKLVAVKDGKAHLHISGKTSGIELGALVKVTIDSTCVFDLQEKTLLGVTWKQNDEREAGPVSPGSSFELIYEVKRKRIDEPKVLSPIALISVPEGFDPPAILTQLYFAEEGVPYRFLYDRGWHITGNTGEHLVLRYLDRGDFIAQAALVVGPKAAAGEHMSPETFKRLIAENSGLEIEQELQVGEVPTSEEGRWIYRVSLLGSLEGLKVLQNYYVLAGSEGHQVMATFTLSQVNVEKVGTKDLVLVGSLELPPYEKSR